MQPTEDKRGHGAMAIRVMMWISFVPVNIEAFFHQIELGDCFRETAEFSQSNGVVGEINEMFVRFREERFGTCLSDFIENRSPCATAGELL